MEEGTLTRSLEMSRWKMKEPSIPTCPVLQRRNMEEEEEGGKLVCIQPVPLSTAVGTQNDESLSASLPSVPTLSGFRGWLGT